MEHLKDMAARIKHARKSNEGKEIKVDDKVIDIFCHRGTVTKIHKPKNITVENHGFIYVKQSDDYIEHYAYYDWMGMLKIIT